MTAYRSIDGTDNNQNFNATATDMTRVGTAHFADDVFTPIKTVNPRDVSNNIVGEGEANTPDPTLSAFMYAWGQFIDHDLDLVNSDGVNHIDITIPDGDPVFGDGASIPMTRSIVDPVNHAAINQITGWLDASMVYGSTQAVADSLRQSDGHMITSPGNNLPVNASGLPFGGDVRAAENPALTALQTLFVREHNYQVDQLKAQHPDWDGEHLYQQARAIVGAEIAHITYDEFLPKLLGSLDVPAYHGFDASIDPRISEEFAGAAFRFGHSIVSDDTERVDNNGVSSGELELRDVFFMKAADFNADGGTDGFLRHLAADPAQAMDGRIVDGLRNFLFDPPFDLPVGQDLAAINIQRGHDLGLGTLNETREALGLDPYTTFDQITTDPGTLDGLQKTFTGGINQVDLWTGGLSEHHAPGAMLGETFATIIGQQFDALRTGDQFYYENQLDPATLAMVQNTSLSDIIERDTDTDVMQADAFLTAERHASDVAPEDPNAPQLIIGTTARDNIRGGQADDTLVVSGNVQNVAGGGGNDTFVFDFSQSTTTVVRDFHVGSDLLEIHGVDPTVDFSAVHVSSNPTMTLVDIGQDHIKLLGVDHVSASDFLFHV